MNRQRTPAIVAAVLAVWAAALPAKQGSAPTALQAASQTPRCVPARSFATIESDCVSLAGRSYPLYPETLETLPEIPSPLTARDGTELVVVSTADGKFGIAPVTLKPDERQCVADAADFPTLARTGLHSVAELDSAQSISGRPVAGITELARPGRLSTDGFLGAGEDIVSVLRADNRIVAALGLTHPELARPLFHIWNLMNIDLKLDRWDMALHRWGNITGLRSHGRTARLVAGDTKGGQLSIFADGIEGSFWIEITGEITSEERQFLKKRYGRLGESEVEKLVRALTRIRTGELQPHYITWYGFYEGRTPWRTDPITIAFVFGLRALEDIENAFPGRLYEVMMSRLVEWEPASPVTKRQAAEPRR